MDIDALKDTGMCSAVMRIKLLKNIGIKQEYILLFFCFFPFIGVLKGFDHQPFALIAAILLLIRKPKVRIIHCNLFMICISVLLVALGFSFLKNDVFSVVKRLYSYVCILIIPIAVYNSGIDIKSEKFENHIRAYMMIWFVVALVQRFINKRFLSFLLSEMRTDELRGVTSLACEPSFYGFMAFFFFLFTLEFKRHKAIYMAINLVQIFLLAQSAVTTIYLAIFVGMMLIAYAFKLSVKNMMKILFILLFSTGAIVFLIWKFKNARLGVLLHAMLNNPMELVLRDESVHLRLGALADSFFRFPFPDLLGGVTIMSGYGGLFLDLGVFAVIFAIYFWCIMRMGYDGYYKLVIPVTISICMFSAIQLSSPVFALFLGLCIKKSEIIRSGEVA